MKVGTDGVLLGAWCDVAGCRRVLDIGTGSGLIALMVAQRNPDTIITGVEIVTEAAVEASENAAASPWSDRIDIVNADFGTFAESADAGCYDLIVSNPPFFVTDTKSPEAARAAARHGHGLGYADILRRGLPLLAEGGRIALVSPADREADIMLECSLAGLSVSRLCRVYTKPSALAPSRLLWEVTATRRPIAAGSLVIGSAEYNSLLRDFYLAL